MSAPMEMVANTILETPKSPRRRRGRDVKDRDTTGLSVGESSDAASVRAKKVTMAAEHLTSARDQQADDSQEHLDVFV